MTVPASHYARTHIRTPHQSVKDSCSTRLASRGGCAHDQTATHVTGMRYHRRGFGGGWVTMSIRRMTLGTGYRYLMSSVARADEATKATGLARYYTVSGTPPGRFLGTGLAGLNGGVGVQAGTVVTEQHLFRMLGMLQDPVTGAQLGRSPRVDAVAGFDLTFSAPKSVSVAWALADPATQEAILAAHRQALRRVIRYAEEQVFSSRLGKNGALQSDVLGVVAAAFDHWDSRSGDPQLHTHVVILNRVQAPDGKWRTLDSRGLFKAAVALSELYNGGLADYLTASLGWGWEPTRRRHSEVPKWEVAGVPHELQAEFSTRSKAIETSKNKLIERFVEAHGRHPGSAEVLRLRQQATLTTRPDKTLHSLAELTRGWRARAQKYVRDEPQSWVGGLCDRNRSPLLTKSSLDPPALDHLATMALAEVSDKRAKFTRSNILAETLRQLHDTRFQSADDRIAIAEKVTALALNQALVLSPPEIDVVPAELQRADGSSRLHARDSQIYTTHEIFSAETRLLETSQITTGPRIQSTTIDTISENAVALSADQTTAVQKIATSGRGLDVLIGAAGTGKSTTMSGLRTVWEREHGPGSVVGLAPSAAAADVLAVELGIQTENTAKWLTELALRP
jgi:conjugative relaxase-like TrwC/TraI family protein